MKQMLPPSPVSRGEYGVAIEMKSLHAPPKSWGTVEIRVLELFYRRILYEVREK